MSFSGNTKEEICRQKLDRVCCAVAESYGVLLFCHTYAPDGIRITTANPAFAARLPKLFKKAFGLSKNAFKRAAGRLLKEGKITVEEREIRKK